MASLEREWSNPMEIQLLFLVKYRTLRWGVFSSCLPVRCISRNKCFWRWLHHSHIDLLSAYFISCSQGYELHLDGLWSIWEMSLGFISSQFESCDQEVLHSHLYVHYTAVNANCSGFGFYFDLIWLEQTLLTCEQEKRVRQEDQVEVFTGMLPMVRAAISGFLGEDLCPFPASATAQCHWDISACDGAEGMMCG